MSSRGGEQIRVDVREWAGRSAALQVPDAGDWVGACLPRPALRLSSFGFAGRRWETIRMASNKMFPDWMFPDPDDHAARREASVDLFAPAARPPLPDRLTPKVLREAIASALASVRPCRGRCARSSASRPDVPPSRALRRWCL